MSSDLFGELLFAQFVQGVELPAKNLVVTETCTSQFDPHDDCSVRDHHGYRAELNLQVLWQFLTTGISRVLEDQEVTGEVWNFMVGSEVDQIYKSGSEIV